MLQIYPYCLADRFQHSNSVVAIDCTIWSKIVLPGLKKGAVSMKQRQSVKLKESVQNKKPGPRDHP